MEKYLHFVGSPARSAWCSCFVSWVLRQAGVLTARFGRARDWFDRAHIIWARGQGKTPQPGDLTGYEWGSNQVHHVGLIEQWPPGVSCVTIEGNTSGGRQNREGDGVFRNWRDKRQIAFVADVLDNPRYTHAE
ncbi:MAG: CHAP domain-containing protein [Janthinobacterium lividum]